MGSLASTPKPKHSEIQAKEKVSDGKPAKTKKKTNSTSIKRQSYSLLKDLNLNKGKGKQSFKEFIEEKKPNSAIQFNTASVYYLKQIAKIEKVDLNHIYTCYKDTKRKPPSNLVQSIRDTSSNNYGYIDASKSDDIKIPLIGITFVDHDLPVRQAS